MARALSIFHIILMAGAYFAPFLISWKIIVPVYLGVYIQFLIWGRCLLNAKHGYEETEDRIFYSEFLEMFGLHFDSKQVKWFVRKVLYPGLAVIALLWQVVLGFKPLLF